MKQIVKKLLLVADRLDQKGFYREANTIDKRIKDLKEIVDIQCDDGNWNMDPYMHGLANGLILGLATVTDKDPKFKEAPEKWLSDKED